MWRPPCSPTRRAGPPLAPARRRGRRVAPLLAQELLGEEVRVAAEQDVGAAPRHVRGDRHRALAPRLRDDLRLALVVLGVEDLVPDAPLLEELGELLRLLARDRADQHRLPRLVALDDVLDDGVELPPLRLVTDS